MTISSVRRKYGFLVYVFIIACLLMWVLRFGFILRYRKHNNVDPYAWLKKVVEIIPGYLANKIADLLP